jgi:hypothetical protein
VPGAVVAAFGEGIRPELGPVSPVKSPLDSVPRHVQRPLSASLDTGWTRLAAGLHQASPGSRISKGLNRTAAYHRATSVIGNRATFYTLDTNAPTGLGEVGYNKARTRTDHPLRTATARPSPAPFLGQKAVEA